MDALMIQVEHPLQLLFLDSFSGFLDGYLNVLRTIHSLLSLTEH